MSGAVAARGLAVVVGGVVGSPDVSDARWRGLHFGVQRIGDSSALAYHVWSDGSLRPLLESRWGAASPDTRFPDRRRLAWFDAAAGWRALLEEGLHGDHLVIRRDLPVEKLLGDLLPRRRRRACPSPPGRRPHASTAIAAAAPSGAFHRRTGTTTSAP